MHECAADSSGKVINHLTENSRWGNFYLTHLVNLLEEKHDADVIYLCEAGSRVYGGFHPSSNYNIYGIMKSRVPVDKFLYRATEQARHDMFAHSIGRNIVLESGKIERENREVYVQIFDLTSAKGEYANLQFREFLDILRVPREHILYDATSETDELRELARTTFQLAHAVNQHYYMARDRYVDARSNAMPHDAAKFPKPLYRILRVDRDRNNWRQSMIYATQHLLIATSIMANKSLPETFVIDDLLRNAADASFATLLRDLRHADESSAAPVADLDRRFKLLARPVKKYLRKADLKIENSSLITLAEYLKLKLRVEEIM